MSKDQQKLMRAFSFSESEEDDDIEKDINKLLNDEQDLALGKF